MAGSEHKEIGYHGHRPNPKPGALEEAITKRLIFPPLLAWDIIKIAMKVPPFNLLSKLGQLLVLPACRIFKEKIGQKGNVSVTTYDGAQLDTFEVHPNRRSEDSDLPTRCIIYFCGNGECIQQRIWLRELQKDADEHNAIVIGFNYRGVNHSSGNPKALKDLITDGITQVQRMLDSDFKAEKIILKSHSLGGLVATAVTKHFHEHGKKIKIFSERAPTSLSDTVMAWILPDGHKTKTSSSLLFARIRTVFAIMFVKPFVMLFGYLSGWERNSQLDWDGIPGSSKQALFVREQVKVPENKSSTAFILHASDTMIPPYAAVGKREFDNSLAMLAMGSKALTREEVATRYRDITNAEMKGPPYTPATGKHRDFDKSFAALAMGSKALTREEVAMRYRNIMLAEKKRSANCGEAHNLSISRLTRSTQSPDSPQTGQELFDHSTRKLLG